MSLFTCCHGGSSGIPSVKLVSAHIHTDTITDTQIRHLPPPALEFTTLMPRRDGSVSRERGSTAHSPPASVRRPSQSKQQLCRRSWGRRRTNSSRSGSTMAMTRANRTCTDEVRILPAKKERMQPPSPGSR